MRLLGVDVAIERGGRRLFAGLGFFWVAILFALTMVDYATR